MTLPPGLVYLSANVPQLVIPPSLVYVFSSLAKSHYGVVAPLWLITPFYLLSWPLAIFFYIQWRDWKVTREAAAIGATLPPRLAHKYPGGFDILKTVARDAETRILGY